MFPGLEAEALLADKAYDADARVLGVLEAGGVNAGDSAEVQSRGSARTMTERCTKRATSSRTFSKNSYNQSDCHAL